MSKHLIREIRDATKMTQKEFALTYNIPLSTLKKWEQGVSEPSECILMLIENTVPAFNKQLKKYVTKDNEVFYIDSLSKKAYDSKGNMINFQESPEGVIEKNMPIYLKEMFEDLYKVQDRFNRDLYYDKKDKIIWSDNKNENI